MTGGTVYLSTNLFYYLANSPTNPSDEIIPFPTPALLALLTASSVPVSADSVNIQIDNSGNGEPASESNPDSGVSG